MSTPVLNPNSSPSANTNPNSISPSSPYQLELGKFLHQHDPSAKRLYDVMNHVKVFVYNGNESRWETNPFLEGSLFVYKRQQLINNQLQPPFAFAIINAEQNLIQPISSNMSYQADKRCLFYEVIKNDKPQVYSLHFSNDIECQKLHTFINQAIQYMKEQQSRAMTTGELQHKQTIEQRTSADIHQQQATVNIPNPMLPLYGSSRQTPVHITARQSSPITNSNHTIDDPTLSLKRLLNIPSQNDFDNESSLSSQQNSLNLLPPSAFASAIGLLSSPIGANRRIQQPLPVSQPYPSKLIDREHVRNVLLHLIQNNDQFVDIIHQACLSYSTQ